MTPRLQPCPRRTFSLHGARRSHIPTARFGIGEVVRHRLLDFRGVIFDVDPEFANSDEWYEAIPEAMRPAKDQPFYHLLAENAESSYVAYVSQQNLVADDSDEPIDHPAIGDHVRGFDEGATSCAASIATKRPARLTESGPCHRRHAFPRGPVSCGAAIARSQI